MNETLNKGIVIVGIGYNYAEMALNLALSIRGNSLKSSTGIMLIHDGSLPYSVSSRLHFFSHNININNNETFKQENLKANLHKAMFAKLLAYELSPFQETILLDADTMILPGRSVEALFNRCAGSSFLAMTVGYQSTGGEKLDKYTWWCDPEEARAHFQIPAETYLPQINASFVYFDQSPTTHKVFNTAITLWKDKEYKGYTPHHRCKTEELCLNLSCAINGVYPAPSNKLIFHPIFIKMYHPQWTEEKLYHDYEAVSLAGSEIGKENDYRLARLYNKLTEYYRRIFGIGEDYILHAGSKSRRPSAVPFKGFWHVYAKNNWLEIVMEQIYIIYYSGLYQQSDSISVGFLGSPDNLDLFKEVMRPYSKVKVVYNATNEKYYEYPTLQALQNACEVAKEEFYGYYFHTKGSSKADDHSKPWRDYMNHYVLRLWKKSVDALNAGYETSGCNWIVAKEVWEHHYSGNFWWFRSNYVKLLPKILSLKRDNRYEAEMWIGKEKPKAFVLSQKEVNTVLTPTFHPRRKIGLFLSASYQHRTTHNFISALATSGLMDECSDTFAVFYPKNTLEDVIAKDSKFSSITEFSDHSNAQANLAQKVYDWCLDNPTGIVVMLSPTPNDELQNNIIIKLIYDWEKCYKKVCDGIGSLGFVSNFDASGSKEPIYLASSFWANACSLQQIKLPGAKIEGTNYLRVTETSF